MGQPKAAAVTVMQFYPRFVVLGLCMKVVLWVLSLSFAILQMCVCGARTHIVRIHKAHFPYSPYLAWVSSLHSGVVVLS